MQTTRKAENKDNLTLPIVDASSNEQDVKRNTQESIY